MLPRWFNCFPRDQIHIAVSEEFYTDPNRCVNEVWKFLGLPARQLRNFKRYNYLPAAQMAPRRANG